MKFSESKGGAAKSSVDLFQYKDGEQSFRLFGDILPRYMYWVPTAKGKDLPVECLSFDRDKERFTNVETDHVLEFFPTDKENRPNRPQWSYTIQAIDLADGKAKVVPLKKKLLLQIQDVASQLGLDPTDTETGFDVVFKRVKTGPNVFNVEYTVQVLKCKQRALTPAELEVVNSAKAISEIYPRPSPEEVRALLVKITTPEATEADTDKEAVSDLN
jgi:hypothetical protein